MADGCSGLPCKRCRKVTQVGYKCVECKTISHKSCVKIMKNVRIIDDEHIICCGTSVQKDEEPLHISSDMPNAPSTPVDLPRLSGSVSFQPAIIALEIEIRYLKELLKCKDATIDNQSIAIKALNEQVLYLKSASSSKTSTNQVIGPRMSNKPQQSYSIALAGPSTASSSTASPGLAPGGSVHVDSGVVTSAVGKKLISKSANSSVAASVKTAHDGGRGALRKPIVGQLSGSPLCSLRAAPIMAHFHLTRLHPDTKREDVVSYLDGTLPGVVVEQLGSKFPASYSSFKLSVPEGMATEILNPSIWPAGALVNHFFVRRRRPVGTPK